MDNYKSGYDVHQEEVYNREINIHDDMDANYVGSNQNFKSNKQNINDKRYQLDNEEYKLGEFKKEFVHDGSMLPIKSKFVMQL